MAIKITGTFTPSGDFPLVKDNDLQGSFRSVTTLQDRDLIPELNRKWGMLVFIENDQTFYQLLPINSTNLSDNTNWIETKFGDSNLTWYLSQAF